MGMILHLSGQWTEKLIIFNMKIVCGLVVLACAMYLANAADGECTDYGNPNSSQCPGWAPCCSTNGYCGNGYEWCAVRGKRSVLVDHSRRRRAGECSSDYDCPNWAPCCSSYGYCGNQWEWCAGKKNKKEELTYQLTHVLCTEKKTRIKLF